MLVTVGRFHSASPLYRYGLRHLGLFGLWFEVKHIASEPESLIDGFQIAALFLLEFSHTVYSLLHSSPSITSNHPFA